MTPEDYSLGWERGTDSGPQCVRCKETIWIYRHTRCPDYIATCSTCHMVEGSFPGPDVSSPSLLTVEDLKACHEAFRLEGIKLWKRD